jgi:hypothetical protein
MQVPPIVNMLSPGQDGNYTLTGSSILFIEFLAAKLNFTYIFLKFAFILTPMWF